MDEATAPLIHNELWKGILFILLAILIEAGIMRILKYNLRLGKTLLDSFIVNIVSLAFGFTLVTLGIIFNSPAIINLLLFYVITVVIESAILYFLNRNKLYTRSLLTAILMNLVSYILLSVIINFV